MGAELSVPLMHRGRKYYVFPLSGQWTRYVKNTLRNFPLTLPGCPLGFKDELMRPRRAPCSLMWATFCTLSCNRGSTTNQEKMPLPRACCNNQCVCNVWRVATVLLLLRSSWLRQQPASTRPIGAFLNGMRPKCGGQSDIEINDILPVCSVMMWRYAQIESTADSTSVTIGWSFIYGQFSCLNNI